MPRLPIHLARAALLSLSVLPAACGDRGSVEAPDTGPPADYDATVQAWRDKHEEDYRREYVSIAGLHLLEPGAYAVGSASDNDIVFSLAFQRPSAASWSERDA